MLSLWRFVYTEGFTWPLLSPLLPIFLTPWTKFEWVVTAFQQGIGRHSKEEVAETAEKDLRSLSIYLGNIALFLV